MSNKKLAALGLIFAILGVYAYVYVSQQKPASKSPVNSATAVDSGTSTSPGGIPGGAGGGGSPTVSNPNAFKVPEVGLQLTVPASLADLTYKVSPGANGSQVVSFSTQSLTAAIPACSAQHPGGAFDTISRANGQYQPPANPADGGLLYQTAGYYFAYQLPNGPCAKNLTVSQQRLLDAQAQDFYTAVHSAKPINP